MAVIHFGDGNGDYCRAAHAAADGVAHNQAAHRVACDADGGRVFGHAVERMTATAQTGNHIETQRAAGAAVKLPVGYLELHAGVVVAGGVGQRVKAQLAGIDIGAADDLVEHHRRPGAVIKSQGAGSG